MRMRGPAGGPARRGGAAGANPASGSAHGAAAIRVESAPPGSQAVVGDGGGEWS
jgi:hypothetical protein